MRESGRKLTVSDLFRQLADKVPGVVEADKHGAQQHPQMRSYPGADQEIEVVLEVAEGQP